MAAPTSYKCIRSTKYLVRLLIAGIAIHFLVEILFFLVYAGWKVGRDFSIPRSILLLKKAAGIDNQNARTEIRSVEKLTTATLPASVTAWNFTAMDPVLPSKSEEPSSVSVISSASPVSEISIPPSRQMPAVLRGYVIISVLRDPPKTLPAGKPVDPGFWLQRIACTSWVRHFPQAAVHVWMDTSEGCATVLSFPEMQAARCTVIQDVSEEHRRPFIHSIWAQAAAEYPTRVLIWLNGDIVATPALAPRLDAAFAAHPGAVAVARRTDFDLPAAYAPPRGGTSPALTTDAGLREVEANATRNGTLHDPHGIDLFALPADSPVVSNFPPFLVGVYRWDNWLLVWALRERVPVVDVSEHGLLFHALMPNNAERHSARRGAVYNYVLCKKEIGELYRLGSVLNADFTLIGRGAAARVGPSRVQSVGVTLARRVSATEWLALVAVDERYLGVAARWRCRAARAGVAYHAFIALDEPARAALAAANESVVTLADLDLADDVAFTAVPFTQRPALAAAPWAQKERRVALRAFAVNRIMDMGFNVVVADVDSEWVQDPLGALDDFATLQGQEEPPPGKGFSGSFLAVRASLPGILFWQKLCECQRRNLRNLAAEAPGSYEPHKYSLKACFDYYHGLFIKKNFQGFTSNLFPPKYFPSAAAFYDNFTSAKQGVLPFVIHSSLRRGPGPAAEAGPDADALLPDGTAPGREAWQCAAHPLRPDGMLVAVPANEPQVRVAWPAGSVGPRFRIHVVTMSRPQALRRLLDSLRAGSYEGFSVAVVLLVVHPGGGADEQRQARWAETYGLCAGFRMGAGVVHKVVNRSLSGGLLSQWIDPWAAQDPNEVLITLEDTAEVLPGWFGFVVRLTQRYLDGDPATGGDTSLAGFGLQRQQAIIGQRPGLRFGRATPRAILDKDDVLYRYQLPMTWGGAVWFPHAWSAFRAWLLKVGLDKARGVASLSTPCVPNFVTNQWWAKDPSRFWSAWVIRFMFEHGYYFLYTNLPQQQTLFLKEGEGTVPFDAVDSLVLPGLPTLPLYDFHFRRVRSAEALRWNSHALSPGGLDRCYSLEQDAGNETGISPQDADRNMHDEHKMHKDDDQPSDVTVPKKRFIIISAFRDPPTDEESPARAPVSELAFLLQRLACISWFQRFPESTVGIHVWMDSLEGCRNVSSYPELKNAKCSLLKRVSEEHERPFVNSIWAEAATEYPESILIWLNSDTLVISSGLFERIENVFSNMHNALVVARGAEVNLSQSWKPQHNLTRTLQELEGDVAKNHQTGHSPFQIDLFALSADSPIIAGNRFPPFLVGADKWEIWLLFWSLVRERLPVVDISNQGLLLHLLTVSNSSDAVSQNALIYNDLLCKKEIGELYRISTVTNADFIMQRHGTTLQIVTNKHQSVGVNLARRMGKASWIAVVTVSKDFLGVAYQWLCNAKRAEIKYYVFLALDEKSRVILSSENETVVSVSDFDIVEQEMLQSVESQDSTRANTEKILVARSFVLNKIIDFGFNVIAADLDSIWIQDPLKALDSIATLQIPEREAGAFFGFIAIRSTVVGRRFWQSMCDCQRKEYLLATGSRDSTKNMNKMCFDKVRTEFLSKQAEGFAVKTLSLTYFPTSDAFYSISYSAREGALPFIVPLNNRAGDSAESRLKRVDQAGLRYQSVNTSFHICTRHPLSPGYEIALVPNNKQEVKLDWQKNAGKLRFRIQITTSSTQPEKLNSLLQSLQTASYSGFQVAVVFLVAFSGPGTEPEGLKQRNDTLKLCRSFRLAAGVIHKVVELDAKSTPISQWIDPWSAQDGDEVLITLDDNSEVHRAWFGFVSRVAKRYFKSDPAAGGDASLAGFGLQRQQAIIGQRPGLKFGRSTPHALLSKSDTLYRYQLPMTTGAVWLPHAWSAFRAWLLKVGLDKTHGVSRVVTPCVPNFVTNQMWTEDQSGFWSAWVIRFMFEHGYYFLYTNLPQSQTPIRDGDDSVPFDAVDSLVLPGLQTLPLYDFHFRQVPSAEALRWNAQVLAPTNLESCFLHNQEG